ncbi:C-terminal binding protein [Herbiconiux daphne]|uniref:C-terminal binding protein n=1 Tax=Herbiconiux daphne TaxID=2970914 RepID=A0ABT2H805_9MICO|nr:C-terminal binding protein [Herbiconiux daphne]MCS5736037.1 C-terminal binding protein [Herbiconiux daphne]
MTGRGSTGGRGSMKVVLTSTAVPIGESDLDAYRGLDVAVSAVDGTDPDALRRETADADALIVLAEHISRGVIENLRRCRSITRLGVGVDTVDIGAATERGIWVTNVPDANYREVATHAVAMALGLARRLVEFDRAIDADGWASTFAIGAGMRRADDQTFGLLGLGRIGRRVAEIAAAIGYRVVAFDPGLPSGAIEEAGVESVGFDELVEVSDILSLHVPLTGDTQNIIDRPVLERMPSGSILINVSRGGLVDERALADAIIRGHLAGAGLDAFAHEPLELGSPLRGLDRVLLSPHAAHFSQESWQETRRKAHEEAARVLRGERPRYAVNDPSAIRAAAG